MSFRSVATVAGSILLGLIFFGLVMGLTMGMVAVNASITPDIVWFPLPATVAIGTAMWLAQRYWGIGLEWSGQVAAKAPWGRVYVIGIGLTVLGLATCAVQGKYTGYTRATELLATQVSPAFDFAYAIYMSVFAAVLAEATFRGVVQTRMQRVLGVWPVVLIIATVNVLAHRWGPEITLNWLGLFVTLAGWTYLRWFSNSLWPPLVMHTVSNFAVALVLWYDGPIQHATMSSGTTAMVAATGLAGLAVSISLARGIRVA